MKKAILLILIIIVVMISMVGCSNLTNQTLSTFDYFSTITTMSVSYDKHTVIEACWGQAQSSLYSLEKTLSVYKEDSDIDKFNKADKDSTIEISKITYDVLDMSKKAYVNTNGAYNPALYLLSDLWGFTDRFINKTYSPEKPYDRENPKEQLPETKYIEGFLSITDFSQVTLSEVDDKYYVYKPNQSVIIDGVEYTMYLDLGGIVKGYAAAGLTELCRTYSIEYGYITLGSSSLSLLERNKKGQTWDLKLKDPKDSQNYYMQVSLTSAYVSTSGNYEQYYELNGKRYCHIINPFTGYPIENNNLSATCVIPFDNENDYLNASYTDAYSTALMVMSLDEAKEFISKNNLKVYIALKDGDIYKVYTNDSNSKILANYEAI